MPVVKSSSKGQIVIPKEVRDQLGIKPGKRLLLRVVGQHAEIVPLADDPIKAMRGMLKSDVSLAEELLEQRRRDDELENPRRA